MQMLFTTISNTLLSTPLVLASIITQSGSSPRTAGARMLVLPGGGIKGTIGGGRYESEAISEALDLLQKQGNARSIFFALNKASDMDMICGGNILVLLQHIAPTAKNIQFFSQAAEAERSGEIFAMLSSLDFANQDLFRLGEGQPINNGALTRHLIFRDEKTASLPADIKLKLAESWSYGAPALVQSNESSWLIEPFLPAERIHIIGGGHVSRALANIAEGAGFATSILDDRAEFANQARFPNSKVVLMESLSEPFMHKYFAKEGLGERDAVVIVTRGHAFDRDALAAALCTGAGYIGMIGSDTKRRKVYEALIHNGFKKSDFERVYSPIGLDIGAETPEEIAVSIIAELIQWRREGKK